MTGVNCAQLHGAHFGPYPPSTVRPMLEERNLFARAAVAGRAIDFANAFPQMYFERVAVRPAMMPTIASSYLAAGRALHTAADLGAGRAVSAEFLNARWPEMGHPDIAPITIDEAGKHLAAIVNASSFTMFEYWLTDKAGHARDMAMAVRVTEALDAMLGAFFNYADMARTTVVITSDHGNMEDLTTGSHTLNPVPLIAVGASADAFTGVHDLTGVAPAILQAMG